MKSSTSVEEELSSLSESSVSLSLAVSSGESPLLAMMSSILAVSASLATGVVSSLPEFSCFCFFFFALPFAGVSLSFRILEIYQMVRGKMYLPYHPDRSTFLNPLMMIA